MWLGEPPCLSESKLKLGYKAEVSYLSSRPMYPVLPHRSRRIHSPWPARMEHTLTFHPQTVRWHSLSLRSRKQALSAIPHRVCKQGCWTMMLSYLRKNKILFVKLKYIDKTSAYCPFWIFCVYVNKPSSWSDVNFITRQDITLKNLLNTNFLPTCVKHILQLTSGNHVKNKTCVEFSGKYFPLGLVGLQLIVVDIWRTIRMLTNHDIAVIKDITAIGFFFELP